MNLQRAADILNGAASATQTLLHAMIDENKGLGWMSRSEAQRTRFQSEATAMIGALGQRSGGAASIIVIRQGVAMGDGEANRYVVSSPYSPKVFAYLANARQMLAEAEAAHKAISDGGQGGGSGGGAKPRPNPAPNGGGGGGANPANPPADGGGYPLVPVAVGGTSPTFWKLAKGGLAVGAVGALGYGIYRMATGKKASKRKGKNTGKSAENDE